MLTDAMKQTIEAATVRIKIGEDGFGSGVLIPGNMILTATHCVEHTTDGGMTLGAQYNKTLETSEGSFKACPIMVECVTDIAILGPLDGQEEEEFEEAMAFEAFCETVEPIDINMEELNLGIPIPVYVRTCEGKWISGEATIFNVALPYITTVFTHPVPPGTSGSPIVDNRGQIVGIVSTNSEDLIQAKSSGHHPVPAMALPSWILRRIENGRNLR